MPDEDRDEGLDKPDTDAPEAPESPESPESDEATSGPWDVRRVLIAGIAVVVALAALFGWFGQQAYLDWSSDQLRNELLQAGRQGAVNLTTIDYVRAEADVQRVLDASTGVFRADFKSRSSAFIDVVKSAQSKSTGTVTEAAVESVDGESGQVLVVVSVSTTTRGVDDAAPRYWRMRLTVTKDDGDAKVSKVEFVR